MKNSTVLRLSAAAAGVALLSAAATPALAQKPLGDQRVPPYFAWTLADQKARASAIEKAYQTAVVARGGQVRELPAAAAPIAPRIAHHGRTFSLEEFMSANNMTGVIALKDGKIILETYGSGRTADERWPSTGLAQAMTATLVGAAIKDRWVRSEYDLVSYYLPDLRDTAYQDVSLRRLMSMSSGVKWSENYASATSDVRSLAAAPYRRGGMNPTIATAARLGRDAQPGRRHAPNMVDADLVGLALDSALAGKSLAQYASEKIWAACGMEQDAVWAVDAAGVVKASGPLSMTLRDAARFGQFLLDNGRVGDRDVLPANWTSQAAANQLNAGASGEAGYFFTPREDGAYEANGLFGQGFYVNPSENLVIVVNAAAPKPNDAAAAAARDALITAIRSSSAAAGQT